MERGQHGGGDWEGEMGREATGRGYGDGEREDGEGAKGWG